MSSTSLREGKTEAIAGNRGRTALRMGQGFLYASLLTSAVLWLIAWKFPQHEARVPFPDRYLPHLANHAIGSETDRLQFLTGIVLFPTSLLGWFWLTSRSCARTDASYDSFWKMAERPALIFCLVLWGITALASLGETSYGDLLKIWEWSHPFPYLSTLVALSACYGLARWPNPRLIRIAWVLSAILVAVLLTLAFAFLFVDERRLYSVDPKIAVHFNATYHSVVQVYLGKTLLVNTNNQYGQYPTLLMPLFSLIGLNVAIYSALMQGLTVFCFGSIFLYLRRVLTNPAVCLTAYIAIIALPLFVLCTFLDFNTIYYQYVPIRMFMPAILLLVSERYLQKRSSKAYYVSLVLFSAGVLWNLDSGVVVFLSWLLCLCYLEFATLSLRQAATAASRHVTFASLSLVGVLGLYAVFLRLWSGHWPDIHRMTEYQKLFYVHGFYMKQMPLLHPWNLVMLVYGGGMTWMIWKLFDKSPATRDLQDLQRVSLLVFLGVGIFTYYQGRSHDLVFPLICYPAVILFSVAVDRILAGRIPTARPKLWRGVALCSFIPVAVFTPLMLASMPHVLDIIERNSEETLAGSHWSEDREFIRMQTVTGHRVMFVGGHWSGMFHLCCGKPCDLDVPGFDELILRDDLAKIYTFTKQDPRCRIFVDTHHLTPLEMQLYQHLLRNNRLDAQGPGNRLYAFGTPK